MSTNTPDFSNADEEQIHEQERREQEDRQEELTEGEHLARKISQRREEKTIHVRIEGERVPFTPLGGEMDEVEDMLGEFGGLDEEDMDAETHAKYQDARARVDEILGARCKHDAFTAGWFQETFTAEERQEILGDLASGGIEGDDAAGFRAE